MFLKKTLCFAALALAVFNANAGPLSIENGLFMKDGKPYYGVGVNYFDGFTRYTRDKNSSYKAGLKVLKDHKIPFIRISTIGFWPKDTNSSYVNNANFHTQLTEFLDEAHANGIGVIVDVFFNWTAIADMEGDPIPMWGVHDSKTRARMRAITIDIVGKHKDHPALWGWEFSNEASSFMDLTVSRYANNYNWLPSKPEYGSPKRTTDDNFTQETIKTAIADFAKTVRDIDTSTPIFSGNNVPRANAYHLRYAAPRDANNSDSREEFGKVLAENDPAPVDTLSMHLYPNSEGTYFGTQPSTIADIVSAAMERSKLETDKRPFFLGEFGADAVALGEELATAKFYKFKEVILDQKVQMSALWVFDYSALNADFNVNATRRSYQLRELKDMNEKMSAW
jgi:endo-1,4-beta-mannosidase